MSRYGIIVLADKCIGCHACAIACKQENQVAPGIFWNQIQRIEDPKARTITWFRTSCQHCDNPACLPKCPFKAIYKGEHGEVLVDRAKCVGCKTCLAFCPYGAPKFNDAKVTSYYGDKQPLYEAPKLPHTDRKPGQAEHCTLCAHRTAKGGKPACVIACGVGVLNFVDYDNPTEQTKGLIEKAVAMNEAAGTNPKVRYISQRVDFRNLKAKIR